MITNSLIYRDQVALMLRMMPVVLNNDDFALHGGTAINLFYTNLLRYSTDLDLTYIPIEGREESFEKINTHLSESAERIRRIFPDVKVEHLPNSLKLFCYHKGIKVKVEVNNIKRGVLGQCTAMSLCEKAQDIFASNVRVKVVPFSQLYGGKICAALTRQHPRDIFDYIHMGVSSFEDVKKGFLLSLLGDSKPIVEVLNPILSQNQEDVIEKDFKGMTEIAFIYNDYHAGQRDVVQFVNRGLTEDDREFLVSFEKGFPNWEKCCAGDLSQFPSVKWKMLNIQRLKSTDEKKLNLNVEKLQEHFSKKSKIDKTQNLVFDNSQGIDLWNYYHGPNGIYNGGSGF